MGGRVGRGDGEPSGAKARRAIRGKGRLEGIAEGGACKRAAARVERRARARASHHNGERSAKELLQDGSDRDTCARNQAIKQSSHQTIKQSSHRAIEQSSNRAITSRNSWNICALYLCLTSPSKP
eukprot:3763096-Prymnesium_polylepis.1